MGVIDNIYVLNYLINRQIEGKKERMVVMFLDMKAVFDSVDRKMLVKAMRDRGMSEELVGRCERILRETISKVRVGGREGERF